MRSFEQCNLALECLKLAHNNGYSGTPAGEVVERTEAYYAFITGTDADDAKAKLKAVLGIIAPCE